MCSLYVCSLIDASRNVQGREEVCSRMCQRALTGKRALTGGGALKLLEHAVLLDAARDDDGGVETEPLAREVDLLGRLRTVDP